MKPKKRVAVLVPKTRSAVTVFGALIILLSLTRPGYAQAPLGDGGTNFRSGQHQTASGVLAPPTTIDFGGHSIVKDEELADVTSNDVDREISTSELLEILDRLTRYYIDRDHVRSKAIISDQNVDHGQIAARVVEDRLSEMTADGPTRLKSALVDSRIRYGVDSVFDVSQLQDRIEFLLPDPTIGRLDAWLNLGPRADESHLALDAEKAPPHTWDVIFANNRSSPLGVKRGAAQLRVAGVTGRNGLVSFGFGLSEDMQNDRAGYGTILDAKNVHLVTISNDGAFEVVEKPFIRTAKRELRPAAFAERKRSGILLRHEPFSIAAGIGNGKSKISVLRLKRNDRRLAREQALVLQGVRSLGSDLLGTKQNGRNFADTQPILDPSLAVEQIGIGGSGTGEKALVFDNGWISATALQIPVGRLTLPGFAEDPDGGLISLSPFIDTGDDGLNNETPTVEGGAGDLFSVGAGIGWQITNQTDLRLGVDIPLGDASSPESDDSQGLGFQFRLATELNN